MRKGVLKIFCFLFVVCLLAVGCINLPVSAADVQTGKCGKNLTFTLDDSGVMTISGTGKMWDFRNDASYFDYHKNPWEKLKPQIKKVVFESGITYIGADAFAECENLKKVTFTNTITEIGCFSFRNCTKLGNVTLPKKLQAIDQQAFDNCDSITSVKIPDTVTFLDGSIFGWCDALTEVYIGGRSDGGSYVFANCPFRYCTALENIEVSPDNYALTAVDGVLYSKDLKTLVQYPAGRKEKNYTLLATTETIFQMAIEGNPYLESLTLPEALCGVDALGIDDCSNLTSIHYAGSQAQWAKVAINEDNRLLDQVTIYFNSNCKHTYSNSCDKTCNVCKAKRTIKHTYSNDCDTTCNVCSATRTVKHTYSNDCDTTCNACKAKRTAKHTYTNSCDTTCNACKAKRTIEHTYTNSCDTKCNVCNAKRTIKHTYTNGCDTTCNVCKAKRSITHKYKTTTTKATLTKNGSVVKKCTECGKVASSTAIKYAKTFKLSATSYTYDKKEKKPGVTVKDAAGKTLKKGTDYTVSYESGRKNVGTYKVTVKMIGKYSGTKELAFKINPPKTTVSKLTAGKSGISVAITKKTTQVTGYQIQYSTSKTFSKATTETVSGYNTTKITLENLGAKKQYYVRVRTYKVSGGTTYYSGWSASKNMKTK